MKSHYGKLRIFSRLHKKFKSYKVIRVEYFTSDYHRIVYRYLNQSESLLCSAAGDETLRFWRVGQDIKQSESPTKGKIDTMKDHNIR